MTRRSKGGAKAPPTPEQVIACMREHRDWPADREVVDQIAAILKRFSGPRAWEQYRQDQWEQEERPDRTMARDIRHHANALVAALERTTERARGPDPATGFHLPFDQIGQIAKRIAPDLRLLAELAACAGQPFEPWHFWASLLWEKVCAAWFIGRWQAGENPDEDAWRIGKGAESPAVLAVKDLLGLSGLHKSAATISTRALRRAPPGDPWEPLCERVERSHRSAEAAMRGMTSGISVAIPEHKGGGGTDID